MIEYFFTMQLQNNSFTFFVFVFVFEVVWLKVNLSKSEIVPVAEVDGVLELADIFCCIVHACL